MVMFETNRFSTMAVNALSTCVTRSYAMVIWTMQTLLYHIWFHLTQASLYLEMLLKTNILLCFLMKSGKTRIKIDRKIAVTNHPFHICVVFDVMTLNHVLEAVCNIEGTLSIVPFGYIALFRFYADCVKQTLTPSATFKSDAMVYI